MTASLTRCTRGNNNDTRELVREIAGLRARRAALLGFPHHTAWSVAGGTAKTTDAVLGVLASVARAAGNNARREVEVLAALAREDGIEDFGLFTDEGVAVVRPGAARRCRGEGRGLPMMGVLTQPVRKTSTCLTLPSRALT